MKRNVIGILICMMFIVVPVLSAAGIMNDEMRLNIDGGYIMTGWVEQAKLIASDGATDDSFGECISIDGEYAIIGAWLDDDNGGDSGSAYIFKRNGINWTQQAKLTASDGAAKDHFGISVSIDGDYAIIGANFDDDNGEKSGSAYLFKRNQPPDPPSITGPKHGKVRMEYQYNFSLSDPHNDSMYLRVDWGNGTPEPWQGPYNSDTIVRINHTWNQQGTFIIRAQAKDIYNVESEWGILEVTMPKNKANYFNFDLLEWLFERFSIQSGLLYPLKWTFKSEFGLLNQNRFLEESHQNLFKY